MKICTVISTAVCVVWSYAVCKKNHHYHRAVTEQLTVSEWALLSPCCCCCCCERAVPRASSWARATRRHASNREQREQREHAQTESRERQRTPAPRTPHAGAHKSQSQQSHPGTAHCVRNAERGARCLCCLCCLCCFSCTHWEIHHFWTTHSFIELIFTILYNEYYRCINILHVNFETFLFPLNPFTSFNFISYTTKAVMSAVEDNKVAIPSVQVSTIMNRQRRKNRDNIWWRIIWN